MQFNQEINPTQYTIRAYGPGEITITLPWEAAEPAPEAVDAIGPEATRIRQEVLTRSLVITPEHLDRDWPPQAYDDLESAHFEAVAALEPEVVLLGTGARLRWPDPTIIAPLMQAGIGFEVMDTAAACRTYNILMADGRRVAAALMMIE